ncbi:hypothetical protein RclHR1_00210013 [Rhizophagus clarus]|uniref:BTB/POZ domain-containing protein n=1 Tax=Rhizophagus clarus TaxID=94130 RepID=A0A2Z6QSD1_9GLOM|nr:hypothetical protein RclHR1_00210013 [Rhizophagus clarus]GES81058.1 BTB/POZ domain-containing protein [Rhizophagus clarus]
MSSTFYSELSSNLGLLLNNDVEYNVVIRAGDDADYKEFHAHSIILRSRSPYFQNLFTSSQIKEIKDQNDIFTFKFPSINKNVFQTILNYIYTGNIDFTNKQGEEIFYTLFASYKFSLDALTKFTENHLIENHSEYLRKYPVEILQSILNTDTFNDLRVLCLDTICYKPKLLFHANNFAKLPALLLEIILKRDDLNLVEIEIWENLIKWGVAQVSRQIILSDNPNEWTKENFIELERKIHNLIPLVRFYEISSEDYFKKVGPYEVILPKELKHDILQFHMVPGHPSKIKSSPRVLKSNKFDSELLNQEHFIALANLIDNKNEESAYIKNIPYNFKLVERKNNSSFDPSRCVLKKFGPNNSNSFVIVYNIQVNYCVGKYIHRGKIEKCAPIKDFTFITSGLNVHLYKNFKFNSRRTASREIFQVEKVIITNTLEIKDDKVRDADYKNEDYKDRISKISLVRRVTTEIFGGKKAKSPKDDDDW